MSKNKGFTLVELLVVITIFVSVSIIVVQVVLVTIRGSLQVDRNVNVRENLDYVLGVVGREIQSAKSIDSCTGGTLVNYTDADGAASSFECKLGSDWGYVELGGQRLTSDNVAITSCNFSCSNSGISGVPEYVDIGISGVTKNSGDIPIDLSTRISLRNY